jgi:hypothetical protein
LFFKKKITNFGQQQKKGVQELGTKIISSNMLKSELGGDKEVARLHNLACGEHI